MRKFIAPLLVILLMSCQEDELKLNNESASVVETLREYTLALQIFQDVGNNSGDAILSMENLITGKSSENKSGEPVITVLPADLVTFPKTISIDYMEGVLCKDGITRKGVVTIVSTDWYRNNGSEHTVSFDNYYHENYKVEGVHYVKNLGENDDQNLEYSVMVENGKITTENGGTINYNTTSTRTWIAGSDTPLNIWDDEYLLNGTQSGTSTRGVQYTLVIEEPLHFILLPRNIKSGILDIEVGNLSDIKIDYTNSTITILGVTYPW